MGSYGYHPPLISLKLPYNTAITYKLFYTVFLDGSYIYLYNFKLTEGMILYQIISKEEDHMTCNTFKDGEALFTEPIDSRLNLQLPKSFMD